MPDRSPAIPDLEDQIRQSMLEHADEAYSGDRLRVPTLITANRHRPRSRSRTIVAACIAVGVLMLSVWAGFHLRGNGHHATSAGLPTCGTVPQAKGDGEHVTVTLRADGPITSGRRVRIERTLTSTDGSPHSITLGGEVGTYIVQGHDIVGRDHGDYAADAWNANIPARSSHVVPPTWAEISGCPINASADAPRSPLPPGNYAIVDVFQDYQTKSVYVSEPLRFTVP